MQKNIRELVTHQIDPVFDDECKVLILGTMPSPKSREVGFYYGHPQNRFWKIMAELLDEEVPADVPGKREMLLRHHIALWDVLKSCTIEGASDSSIRDAVANDIASLLKCSGIKSVFCTGATSYRYYSQMCEGNTEIPAIKLPSPSAANAAWSLERLVEAYSPILEALK